MSDSPRVPTFYRIAVIVTVILGSLSVGPSGLPAQVVEGIVVGERDGDPVSHANLILLDSVYGNQGSTLTDGNGRFRLEAAEPGSYLLLLERPDHANELSGSFTLHAGDTLGFRMEVENRTVERMAALSQVRMRREALTEAVLEECGAELEGTRSGILTGVVRDSTSGVGLPGMGVVIEWGPDATQRAEVRTRGDGSYTACAVPAGDTITLAVRDVEGGSPLAELVLEAGVMHVLDLPVEIASFGAASNFGQIVGRVWDEAGRPVSGAAIGVEGEAITAVTNVRGFFALEEVPQGEQLLTVEHLGYGIQERGLVVRAGRTHDVEIRLVTEPVELEPITVTVRPRWWYGDMVDLQHRMNLGFGHFLTREDFEARAQMPLGWAMSGVPGVNVRRSGSGTTISFRRAPCGTPVVYLDGVKFQLGARGLDEFNTSEIEAVELYAGAAQIPGQFGGSDAQCGVVVIWTRRPGSW